PARDARVGWALLPLSRDVDFGGGAQRPRQWAARPARWEGAGQGRPPPPLQRCQCGWETWKQATSYCDTAWALPFAADGVPGAPAYTFAALVAKPLVVLISPGGPVGSA